jgi:hypothetical protein
MNFNFMIFALAALVPLVTGFIWYNPKTFGTIWMKSSGLTEDNMKGANMPLIFGLTFIFSFFIAMMLNFLVIHQWGVFSTLGGPSVVDGNAELETYLADFMTKFGTNFRTFKHGVLHGAMSGLFFAMPIIAINALFERKGFKYIAVNAGYWIVTLAIMGGIICQYA